MVPGCEWGEKKMNTFSRFHSSCSSLFLSLSQAYQIHAMRSEGQFPVHTLQAILCGRDVSNPVITLSLIVEEIVTVIRRQTLSPCQRVREQAEQAEPAG